MNINETTPGNGDSILGRWNISRSDIERFQRHPKRHSSSGTTINRLPYMNWLPRGFRPHFVAMCGEFVGTWLFLFFALSGTQVANTTQTGLTTATSTSGTILYISLAFGFSLAVNAWVFFRISGGLFNPAVTLGMCVIGALTWFRGMLLFLAQMLGAICSAAVVSALFPGELAVQTTLGGNTSIAQGLFIEMFLTAELVFTIFMLAAEKHKATFIAPVGIGLSLFISELTGVYFTGGSLNPARSFAPAAVLRDFPGYHWIYWLGPVLGAFLAAGFYAFIKMLEYETANPGQDHDDKEAKEYDPERDADERSPRLGSPTSHVQPLGRSRQNDSTHGTRRSHDRNIHQSPAQDVNQLATGSHEIPRRAVNTDTNVPHGLDQHPTTQHSTDPANLARSVQDHSNNRNSGQFRGGDSGRASKEHMWPEGQSADVSGQRTYV